MDSNSQATPLQVISSRLKKTDKQVRFDDRITDNSPTLDGLNIKEPPLTERDSDAAKSPTIDTPKNSQTIDIPIYVNAGGSNKKQSNNYDDDKSSYDADTVQENEDEDAGDEDDNFESIKKKSLLQQSAEDKVKNPDNLTQIPRLEEDISYLKNKNIQPIDYYLDQCQKYAAINLMQIEVIVPPYQFKYEDITENIFIGTTFTLDASIENLRKMYKNTEKKIYNDVIFVDGKQQLIIKTWELFEPQEQSLTNSPDIKKQKEQGAFYLKTLRLYDQNNNDLTQILTEQIAGEFLDNMFYDTSTMMYNNCLYYFKRHCIDRRSMIDGQSCTKAHTTSEEQTLNDLDNPQIYHIYLQLYKFDFISCEETKINGYQINHIDNNMSSDNNYNCIFSKEFGLKIAPKYDTEKDFLSNQYMILQEYIRVEDAKKDVFFYNLSNLGEKQYVHKQEAKQQDLSPETQMILNLNHLYVKDDSQNSNFSEDKILFIAITEKNHAHFSYHLHELQAKDDVTNVMAKNVEIFKQEYTFRKPKNPRISIQKFIVEEIDNANKKTYFDQYFFIDFRNKITLMYPNYKQKSLRFLYIDTICSKADINQKDYMEFKKIDAIEDSCFNKQCNNNNILQKINHLKQVINYEKINKEHIITFCNDQQEQMLYITTTTSNKVDIIFMKDHHSEETETSKNFSKNKKQGKLLSGLQSQIEKYLEAEIKKKQKGQMEQTHNIFRKNSVRKLIGDKVYDELFKEEQVSEAITFDINTQKVILSTNVDDIEKENAKKEQEKLNNLKSAATAATSGIDFQQKDENKKKRSCTIKFNDFNNEEKQLSCCFVSKAQFISVDVMYTHLQGDFYIFIVRLASSINDIIHRSFVFVRKTQQQVDELVQDYSKSEKSRKNLIEKEDEVKFLTPNHTLKEMTINDVHEQHKLNTELNEIQKLSFEKFVNNKGKNLKFIPFIYQQMRTVERNTMIIFDVEMNEITKTIPINPGSESREFLYIDDEGFSPFKICRASNMEEVKPEQEHGHLFGTQLTHVNQQIKLQIYTIFIEKLGRIQVQDFLIHFDGKTSKISVNQVAQKNILLSRRCIETCNWTHVRNSYAIPFVDDHDEDRKIIGCQFIIKHDESKETFLNLIDERYNNLYTYQSQIVKVGKKKFLLDEQDPENYLYVISSKMHPDIVARNLFDQCETFSILRASQDIIIKMRKPSLDFMLMNTFDSLKKSDFFSSQEVLKGQSLCDICLSDPSSIKFALQFYDPMKQDIKDSIIHELAKGDFLRLQAFKEIGFFPKNLIIRHDFNFVGTISRGLKMSSKRSVKIIMDYILEDLYTADYYNLFMMELPKLLEAKDIDIKNFFKKEEEDMDGELDEDEEKPLMPLNIERDLVDDKLYTFTPIPINFLNMLEFRNIHQKEIEQEICLKLIERDKEIMTPDMDSKENFEIQHTYIDFKHLIIGEKIRSIDNKDDEKLKFDDEYFANLLLHQDVFINFFSQTSVNKFVDYQFETTQKFMQGIFWFFASFFLLPYSITLVSTNPLIHRIVFNICALPQVGLATIEAIQFKEQGISYFQGWNYIDMLQIILFFTLHYIIVIEADQSYEFLPFLKIWLIILSFIKCIHFVSAFPEFGFFINMLMIAITDLIPFLFSYIIFGFFFASLYSSIEANVDDELMGAVGLGKFGRLFLMQWRNSVGKLGFVRYKYWLKTEGWQKGLGIGFVYLIFWVQVMFMLVIMLNFMIAIIDRTYRKVMSQKKIHQYKNKAELNEESYQILKYFTNLQEYKVLVFSTCKDYEAILDEKIGVDDEDLENFLDQVKEVCEKEQKKRKADLKRASEYMDSILIQQRELQKKMDTNCEEYQLLMTTMQTWFKERVKQLYGNRESVSGDTYQTQSMKSNLSSKAKSRQNKNVNVNSSRVISSRISEQVDAEDQEQEVQSDLRVEEQKSSLANVNVQPSRAVEQQVIVSGSAQLKQNAKKEEVKVQRSSLDPGIIDGAYQAGSGSKTLPKGPSNAQKLIPGKKRKEDRKDGYFTFRDDEKQ